MGLAPYALGVLLFIPASLTLQFWQFLLALYVLTFGLAFLETAAHPYVLSMGAAGTANLGFMQLESVRASFVFPLQCFVPIAIDGWRMLRIHDARQHA